jgi:hypothetical protein
MKLVELDLKEENLDHMPFHLVQKMRKPVAAMTSNWHLHSRKRSEGMLTHNEIVAATQSEK